MSYYPDGMRLSQLPGFNTTTMKVEFACEAEDESCGHLWSEYMDVDGSGGYCEEMACPECGVTVSAYIETPSEYRDRQNSYYEN